MTALSNKEPQFNNVIVFCGNFGKHVMYILLCPLCCILRCLSIGYVLAA